MKQRLRKSLSMILSIMMIVTSISVAFSMNASAATFAQAKTDLKTALNNIPASELTKYQILQTHHDTSEGGAARLIIQDNSTNGLLYDAAAKYGELFQTTDTTGTNRILFDTSTTSTPTYHWWSSLSRQLVTDLALSNADGGKANRDILVHLFADNRNYANTNFRSTPFASAQGTNSGTYVASNAGTWNKDNTPLAINVEIIVKRSEFQAIRQFANIATLLAAPTVNTTLSYGGNGRIHQRSGSGCTGYYNNFSNKNSFYTRHATSSSYLNLIKEYYNYFYTQNTSQGVNRVNSNPALYSIDEIAKELANNQAMLDMLAAVSGTTVNTFTAADKAKFFPQHAQIDAYIQNCINASVTINYKNDVEYFQKPGGFNETVNAGTAYDNSNLTEMLDLWNSQQQHYGRLTGLNATQQGLLVTAYGFNLGNINSSRAILRNDLELLWIHALKTRVDQLYTTFYKSNPDDYRPMDDTTILSIYNELVSLRNTINGFTPAHIALAFTSGTQYLTDFINSLTYEFTYRGIIASSTSDKTYFDKIKYTDLSEIATKDIITMLDEYPAKQTAFLANMTANQAKLSAADFAVLYGTYYNDIVLDCDDILHRLLQARFNEEVNTALAAIGNNPTNPTINWSNFHLFRGAMNNIETSIYNYETNSDGTSKYGYISAATRTAYAQLKDVVGNQFAAYISTLGYNDYVQKTYSYPTRIGDSLIDNEGNVALDMARSNTDTFAVNNNSLNGVVSALETLLGSPDFANTLQSVMGCDEPVDIAGCMKNLPTAIGLGCSDAMVNCIVGLTYVEVTKALEETWSDLPGVNGNRPGATAADHRYLFDPNKSDYADIYLRPLHDVLTDTGNPLGTTNNLTGLAIYPDMLAPLIEAAYPQVAATLRTAKPKGDSWDVYNDENRPESENKRTTDIWQSIMVDGNLALDWGVDSAADKSAAFNAAMSAALRGIWPLVKSLLLGQSYEGAILRAATITAVNYSGLQPTADNLKLRLIVENGTEGYSKIFAPIFEGLNGYSAEAMALIPTNAQIHSYATSDFSGIPNVVKAITAPISYFTNDLASRPVNKVLEMLPYMAYAIQFNMIGQLLNELKTQIKYIPDGNASLLGITCSIAGLGLDLSGFYDLDVPDLLFSGDDSALDLSMLNDMNGLIQKLPSCFMDGCNISLPQFDSRCIMTAGTLKTGSSPTPPAGQIPTKRISGNAAMGNYCNATRHYIDADKPTVMYGLLNYLIKGIGQDPNLIGSIIKSEEGISPELQEVLTHMSSDANRPMSIASVVELFNQKEYPVAQYQWVAPPVTASPYRYLGYNNMWTAAKADALANNLDGLVADILTMTGETQTIKEIVDEMLDGFLNAETLKSLTDTLGELELDEMISTLLKNSFGVDIADWLIYKNTDDLNGDGLVDDADQELFFYYKPEDIQTREDFLAALYEMLEPLVPILTFVLNGSDIRVFTNGADEALYFYGSDGYAKGIIPLLQALGVPTADILTPAAYSAAIAANPSNAIKYIIDPIFGIIDEIAANPLSTILEKLPNIIYYLSSNGLATTLNILLHPILVLLDTVRPFYNLNVQTIIGMLAGEETTTPPDPDEEPGFDFSTITATQIDQFTFEYILGIAEQALGFDLNVLKNIIPTHISNYATPFTFLNGDEGFLITELDNGDVFTIIVSLLLEILKNPTNQEKIAEMAKLDGAIIPAIFEVLKERTIGIETIDWFYYTETPVDQAGYEYFLQNPADAPQPASNHSLAYLTYPNDWTEGTANYIENNFDDILSDIVELIKPGSSIAEILADSFTLDQLYNDDLFNSVLETIQDLLKDISIDILDTAGIALDVDLSFWKEHDGAWNVTDRASFIAALSDAISTIEPLINWLLCGKDLRYFHPSEPMIDPDTGEDVLNDLLVLPGTKGYAFALVPILEALGITMDDGLLSADAFDAASIDLKVTSLFNAIFDRVEEILADPVNEVLAMIPNLIYFINADGLTVSVNNLLAPVFNIIDAVNPALSEPIDVAALIPFPIDDISFASLLDFASTEINLGTEEDPLYLNLDFLKGFLTDFWLGGLSSFRSASGDYAFRMDYITDEATHEHRGDLITIVVSLALQMFKGPENAAVFAKLLGGQDKYDAVISLMNGERYVTSMPDWFYFDNIYKDPAKRDEIIADASLLTNITNPTQSFVYLTYPNNWTSGVSEYLVNNFDSIVNSLLPLFMDNATTLTALLKDTVDLNSILYTADNITAITGAIADLLKDIDASLVDHVGAILGIDINAIANYDPGVVNGRDDFLAKLSEALAPATILIEWILCGNDLDYFVELENAGNSLISIKGNKGYENGLVPILEMLGIRDLAKQSEFDAMASADKINYLLDKILGFVESIINDPAEQPIDKILGLVPNLIYFVNNKGLTYSINNLLGCVLNLLDTVKPLGVDVDITELLGGFPLEDISFDNIFAFVRDKMGFDFSIIGGYLSSFFIGNIKAFESAYGGNYAFAMDYANPDGTLDDNTRSDLITIIVSLALQVIDSPNNKAALVDLFGDDGETIYAVLKNILHMDNFPVTYKPINWILTDKAGTGEVLSPLLSTQIFGSPYGKLWTREKAQYIADHLEQFIDNLIHLLGLEIEGFKVDNITDLLNTFIGVSLYTSDNISTIVTAIKDLVAQLNDIPGATHIKALIKESLGVDLDAWNNLTTATYVIADGDRAAFVNALCEILAPINPVLEWILSGKDISFFVDASEQDYILLQGAQGYAYGIIPILEALGCRDVMTATEFNADPDNMLKNVLNTVLDQVDIILADPINELFSVLPGIFYFINSNGLSTSLMNLLQPILVLFDAVQPLIGKNLNEIVGIDLENLQFDSIIDLLVGMLNDSTGAAFIPLVINDIAELTMGRVEKFTTSNDLLADRDAYTMVYDAEAQKADMITVLLRIAMRFLTLEQNNAEVKKLAAKYLKGDPYKYVVVLLDGFFHYASTPNGMDTILGSLFFVAFGVMIATNEVTQVYDNLTDNWKFVFDTLASLNSTAMQEFNKLINDIFAKLFPEGSVLDPEGPAKNGLIKFFEKIIEFFQKIIDFFKNLFN